MTKPLHFLPLGGSGEIGMNLNLYEYDDQFLMVDLGVTFEDQYGIHVVMPDITYIQERRDKLAGLVLTHGHEDHIGAVPYLWDKLRCPIYATPFTAHLVRAKMREAGISNLESLVIVPIGGTVQVGPFDIEYIHLTHSIPEPHALAIKTPAGMVVHTGDWKIDPHPMVGRATDEDRLREIGDEGVLALTCDSTNVFMEGRTKSELDVRESMVKLIGQQENLVAVALFASNVARVETCAIAARENDRHVVLVGRSLYRMTEAARASGYLQDIPEFLDMDKAAGLPRNKVMYLCTGSQGEPRAALTRLAHGSHNILKLHEDDSVIFSSRKIPGNEAAISQLQNALKAKGVRVIRDGEEFTHVSGHPAREELKDMYKLIRPQIIVPVHGEQIHMHEQAKLAQENGVPQAIVPYNGAKIQLAPGAPKVVEEVTSGRWGLDGNTVVPMSSPHIKDRDRITREGAAFVSVVIDKNYSMLEPAISFIGLVSSEEDEDNLCDLALHEMALIMEEKPDGVIYDNEAIEDICRMAVRRAARKVTGRKPFVRTHIMRLEDMG